MSEQHTADLAARICRRNAQSAVDTLKDITGSAGAISDGYHTFDELYEHRCTVQLCKAHHYIWHSEHWDNDSKTSDVESPVYRTKVHSDGTIWPGWFLLVLDYGNKPKQISYHLPECMWHDCDFARKMERAPYFDGHTSADVLKRLAEL
jgi:hypothetical protein